MDPNRPNNMFMEEFDQGLPVEDEINRMTVFHREQCQNCRNKQCGFMRGPSNRKKRKTIRDHSHLAFRRAFCVPVTSLMNTDPRIDPVRSEGKKVILVHQVFNMYNSREHF